MSKCHYNDSKLSPKKMENNQKPSLKMTNLVGNQKSQIKKLMNKNQQQTHYRNVWKMR